MREYQINSDEIKERTNQSFNPTITQLKSITKTRK